MEKKNNGLKDAEESEAEDRGEKSKQEEIWEGIEFSFWLRCSLSTSIFELEEDENGHAFDMVDNSAGDIVEDTKDQKNIEDGGKLTSEDQNDDKGIVTSAYKTCCKIN